MAYLCKNIKLLFHSKKRKVTLSSRSLNDRGFPLIFLKTVAIALKHADYKMTANFFENTSLSQLKNNLKENFMVLKKDEEFSKYADAKKPIIVDFGHGKFVGVIVKE